MDPNTTILRVKRKRGTDPADALLLACKRIRPESSQTPGETVPEPGEAEVDNTVFKLVATVATQVSRREAPWFRKRHLVVSFRKRFVALFGEDHDTFKRFTNV